MGGASIELEIVIRQLQPTLDNYEEKIRNLIMFHVFDFTIKISFVENRNAMDITDSNNLKQVVKIIIKKRHRFIKVNSFYQTYMNDLYLIFCSFVLCHWLRKTNVIPLHTLM